MKIKPPTIAAAALFAAFTITPALAQEVPTPAEQEQYQKKLFALLDANNDGKVTEKEFAVIALWDDFRKYDADSDGKVTKAEYDKQPKKKDYWADLDAAGKGYVTFEECIKNAEVRKALNEAWQEVLRSLKKQGAPHLTLADLPDLTP